MTKDMKKLFKKMSFNKIVENVKTLEINQEYSNKVHAHKNCKCKFVKR